MYRTFTTTVVSLVSLLFAVGAMAGDSLFDRMQGSWVAEGSRTQLTSGRKTHIGVRLQAHVQDNTLYSHSEITETSELPGATPKTYSRDYWIRLAADGSYSLGVGGKLTAVGHFDGSVLRVEQNFGGEAAYVIRSQTRFDDQGSQYDEVFSSGLRKLAETHLRYWLAR